MRACFLYVRESIFADRHPNGFSMKTSTLCVVIQLIEFYYWPVARRVYSVFNRLEDKTKNSKFESSWFER